MGLLWTNGSTATNKFVANNGNLGCVKCSNEDVLCFESDSEKSQYCEECFLRTLKWKFRSALSRRKIFRDNASRRVVVVLDGSRESAFLFRQIEYAMKQKSKKQLLMEPYFIFMLCSMDVSEIRVLQKNLCILRQALSSTYFVVHLAAVFGELRVDDESTCQGLEHLPELIELSKSFRTACMREEMMRILKVRLLQEFSRCIGISKVMTSCNSDVLGRLILNQLCLGRGGRVSNMTDVVEKTLRGTTFIRPLRDFSSQEILTALRLEKVEHYVLSPCFEPLISPLYYAYEASTEGSIQRSTAAFLNRLVKRGFKDTIPTLLSVANKIHISDGTTMCAVCEYSFSGNGELCYTCSAITNELPFPNIVHICSNH